MIDLELTGKNAVVGGSSRGIGKASAIELSLLGASITLLARSESDLIKLLSRLDTSKGQQHRYFAIDYSNSENVKAVAEKLSKDRRTHILVNNSGGPPPGRALDAETGDYLSAFHQHLVAYQTFTQSLVPEMKQAGYGRIINIISTSVKQPIPNLGVSNTIRGAVAGWSKTLSKELGPSNITVNNILPGATYTDRLKNLIGKKSKEQGTSFDQRAEELKQSIPLRRFAQPEELAYAVCFLASPAGAYINGVNLPVDGGRTDCI